MSGEQAGETYSLREPGMGPVVTLSGLRTDFEWTFIALSRLNIMKAQERDAASPPAFPALALSRSGQWV
jgi:hypothetical protein